MSLPAFNIEASEKQRFLSALVTYIGSDVVTQADDIALREAFKDVLPRIMADELDLQNDAQLGTWMTRDRLLLSIVERSGGHDVLSASGIAMLRRAAEAQ